MSSGSDSPAGTASAAAAQKAATFFQYGNDAALKSNFDYAINMYKEACKLVPDNLVYRQALRGIERRKFNNDPSKVGMLVAAKTQPVRLKAKAARSRGKHAEAIEALEDAFVHNPWDVSAAWEAAESAEELGLLNLAQWYVESVQNITKDVNFFKFAAHIHENCESWAKAIGCWETVKKLSPNDQDANRQINALSAKSTIKRANLEDSLERKATPAGPDPAETAEALERLKREQLTPEQRLIKEINEDPSLTHAYIELAEIYRGRGDLEKAEKVLAKGLKANPDDNGITSVYEDTQIARLKKAIEGQTQKFRERPDDTGIKIKLDQLTEALSKYELAAFRRRVNLHPTDSALRLQLGLALARQGKHDEAIGEFQQARNSPAHKLAALYNAGLSFEANSAYKLADRSYREALKTLEEDDRENFLNLHYRLGRVAEALGDNEKANEHYNEVGAIDYNYEDVAQRLRNLN